MKRGAPLKQPLLTATEEATSQVTYTLRFVLATLVVTFIASAAFYWALHSWLADAHDRDAIHREELRKSVVTDNLLSAQRLVDRNAQQEAMLDMMTDQLNAIVINDTAAVTDPPIAAFRALEAAIEAANASCVTQVDALNAVLAQLVQGSNATSERLLLGTCDMTALNNVNETLVGVEWTYNKLSIVGLDFYYYVIQPANGTLLIGDAGILIDNFSPPVLQGSQVSAPLFRAQLGAFSASPTNAEDYFLQILIGDGNIQFLPVAGASPLETVELLQELTIFISFV